MKKKPVRIQTATLQTELPMKIKVLPSHKMAEDLAKLREQLDDLKTKIEARKPDLQKQMKADAITRVTAKGPGGTLYFFELEQGEETLKISKPAAG